MASRSSTRPRTVPPRLQQEPANQQQLRPIWTAPLTEVLANLLVDQVRKSDKQNNPFSKKAWKTISDEFYKKTSLAWDMEQLKNRYAVLKRQYSIVTLLLKQNGFRWDQSTGSITADNGLWNQFIKEHPDAANVKTDGCAIYPQLCVIFSEPVTNGVSNGPVESETLCPEPLTIFKADSLFEAENSLKRAHEQDIFQPLLSPNSRKRARKTIDGSIADAILEMAAASKLRAAAIENFNNRFTITDCVRGLDEMKGVEQRVYFAALDLFKNRYAREIFLSLKGGMRFDWLHNKCSVPSGN